MRGAQLVLRFYYEHQRPLLSVAWLIGLHLPGPGLPVVPHALQIQCWPSLSTKISRQGCEENCVQQPENVQSAVAGAYTVIVLVVFGTPLRPVDCAGFEAMKRVKRTTATAVI